MNDLNRVTLIGRVARDGEIGYLQSGSAKLDFSLAFTTSKKNGNEWVNESNFINLTLWGKTAENMQNYIKKGTQVAIDGHLKVDSYEKDGQKKSLLKVIVDEIQLLGGKKEGGSTPSKPKQAPVQNELDSDDFPEDVPF